MNDRPFAMSTVSIKAVMMVGMAFVLSACQHIQLAGNPVPVLAPDKPVNARFAEKTSNKTDKRNAYHTTDKTTDTPFFILEDWF